MLPEDEESAPLASVLSKLDDIAAGQARIETALKSVLTDTVALKVLSWRGAPDFVGFSPMPPAATQPSAGSTSPAQSAEVGSACSGTPKASSATPRPTFSWEHRGMSRALDEELENGGGPLERHNMSRSTWTSSRSARRTTTSNQTAARGCRGSFHRLRSAVTRVVLSDVFDYVCATLLLVNAGLMGYQVDVMAQQSLQDPPDTIAACQLSFTFIFLAELLLRIFVAGKDFLLCEERGWNIFDLGVVGASLLEVVLDQLSVKKSGGNFSPFRVLRLLRIVRIARVVRVVRFFQELRLLVYSILNSFRALFWAFVLLFCMMFLVAVSLMQSATDYRSTAEPDDPVAQQLALYFGSILKCMYYLLQGVTGGLSWGAIAQPLETVGWFYALLLMVFTAFILLAVMNIITAVFVDAAVQKAQDDRLSKVEEEMKKELYGFFEDMDTDESGFIESSEFRQFMKDTRVRAFFESLGLDPSDGWTLFGLLDKRGNDSINMAEFVEGVTRLKGNPRTIDLATLRFENKRMFQKWNKFMGFVSVELTELGSRLESLRSNGVLAHHPLPAYDPSWPVRV